MSLKSSVAQARACTVCQAALPLGARPSRRLRLGARLLIVGQAPGRKVHATGLPWDDASAAIACASGCRSSGGLLRCQPGGDRAHGFLLSGRHGIERRPAAEPRVCAALACPAARTSS